MKRWLIPCAVALALSVPAAVRAQAEPATSDTHVAKKSKKKKKKHTKRSKHKKHKKHKHSPRERGPRRGFALPVSSTLELGYAHGLHERSFDAAVTRTRLRVVPTLYAPWLIARTPLGLRHQYFSGQSLSETRARAAIELEFLPQARIRPIADAGLLGVWRPNWPDLYQPLPNGDYAPSSRHSYWERTASAGVEVAPAPPATLSASYRYTLRVFRQDDAFDPVYRPNHLTPSDREEHRVELGWRQRVGAARLDLGAAGFERNYFYLFARDAGTGKTHADPRGLPPNPLYHTLGLGAEASVRLPLGRRATLTPKYGVEIMDDTFQGYYSYVEHQPAIAAHVELTRRIGLHTELGAKLRRYGEDSYVAGPNHPPLTFGDRRADYRASGSVSASYALQQGLALTLATEAEFRRTNFPPYEPGVFPASREYDIGWSYDNYRVVAGVSFR